MKRNFSTTKLILENYWDSLRRTDPKNKIKKIDISKYQHLNLDQLIKTETVPRTTKVSSRNFIHNSLYNHNYGYFNKKAPQTEIDFSKIRDNYDFLNYTSNLYKQIDNTELQNSEARQIWHTPTELFRPWYGYALANYILTNYTLDKKGAKYLHIFEVGGGNGTLMLNILDFIRSNNFEIYQNMKYTIIEISDLLLLKQKEIKTHEGRFQIIKKSIFDWETEFNDPCFFISMEVIDNFSHDVVRYDSDTMAPLQEMVLIDEDGDFEVGFEEVTDPLLKRYLSIREETGYVSPILRGFHVKRFLKSFLPFSSNMTQPEFLPTMCLQFFEKLNKYFPKHRLILSDFSSLPDAVNGVDGPVVQTRYNGGIFVK
ncbi:hypothetical protein HK099_005709 [Clydaea vesicula]|uniref:Protein arginine methyltransferase NDUFAF7 n=1 Tax=Clydaea vesicula TaxID=447962 RepID=A0AAD5TZ35_9FUNG|nr:hypothetical protein HK099_005709 [Clydaea vesicula]